MSKELKCILEKLQNQIDVLIAHVSGLNNNVYKLDKRIEQLENSVYNVGFTTKSNTSIVKVNGTFATDKIVCANSTITNSTRENVGTLCLQKEIGSIPETFTNLSGGSYTMYVSSLQDPSVSVLRVDVLNDGKKRSLTNSYEEDSDTSQYIKAIWSGQYIALYRENSILDNTYLYNILVEGVLTNLNEIPEAEQIFIGFEPNEDGSWYTLGRLSNSTNTAPTTQPSAYIQDGWSGGANTYWTNDSGGNEQIVDASTATYGTTPYSGTQCWYAVDLYGATTGGSFSPKLPIQSQFSMDSIGEAQFNYILRGKTIETIFYFKTFTATDDNSTFSVYNGAFIGNDRTGFNINISNSAVTGSRVFTYSYGGGTYPQTDLAIDLPFQTWHKVKSTVTYAADGDPNNDVFLYSVNDGPEQSVMSWPNIKRLDDGNPLVYGTWILLYGSGSTGFYIDNISIRLVV
jgi:hypothetical protein